MHLLRVISTAGFLALSVLGGVARAEWPNDKVVTILVPFPPGGVTDVFARMLAQKLTASLHQTVIVLNKPGAGGLTGTVAAANSPADGYTIFLGQIASHGTIPNLYKKLEYDPIKSFVPVILLSAHPGVLAINPSLPVKSVSELIDLAKSKPGKLKYATAGTGTTFQMSGELFKQLAGVDILPVPYQGGNPAVMATLAGDVDLVFSDFATAMSHVHAGTLRGIGVTSKQRSPAAPDIPSIAETQALKDFEVQSWLALFYPAGVKDNIVQALNTEMNKVLKTQDIGDYATRTGGVLKGGSPEDLGRYVDTELAKWKAVIEVAHIKID